jgi:hypothetical protein
MTEKIDKSENKPTTQKAVSEAPRALRPEAKRALAEAEERRRQRGKDPQSAAREINGRGGLDPARYGDWEIKGIISDF